MTAMGGGHSRRRMRFNASNLPRENFHLAAVAAISRGAIEKMHVEMSGAEDMDGSDDETDDLGDLNGHGRDDGAVGDDLMDVDGTAGSAPPPGRWRVTGHVPEGRRRAPGTPTRWCRSSNACACSKASSCRSVPLSG